MANIEFKGFKLIYANGCSTDEVLQSARTEGILYLVRNNIPGTRGYLVLNQKVYGSDDYAKEYVDTRISSLDAIASTSGTTYISGTITETDGKLTKFTIDETKLEEKFTAIDSAITAITGDTGTIKTAIKDLDATVSAVTTTGATKYIDSTIVEEDGKLKSFTIDETKLDTKIGSIETSISDITKADGTIDTKIAALDATVSGTSTNSPITVKVEQVDGKLTGVEVIDTLGTAAKANVNTDTLSVPTSDNSAKTGLTTAKQVEDFVKASVADLAGAMHFEGVVTGDTLPDASGYAKGDVILMGTKEYVHDGSKWVELGDEGIYLTTAAAEANYVQKKTTIAGVDLQDNITKEELLSKLNVADGAQVNVLDGVKVNGHELSITDKKVDITVTSGTANGTIKVNGADVAVAGLGSAAYKEDTYFDKAGTATTEIAKISGTTEGTESANYKIKVTTTQENGKVTGITVDDSALKTTIDGINDNITKLSGAAVKNVNGKTGNTITLTGADVAVGADVDGTGGTMTSGSTVSAVLADIYTKLNNAEANAYTGITAANNTVTVAETTHGHSVAVKLKQLNDTEKASGLIQLALSDVEGNEGIYGKLFFDGDELVLRSSGIQ